MAKKKVSDMMPATDGRFLREKAKKEAAKRNELTTGHESSQGQKARSATAKKRKNNVKYCRVIIDCEHCMRQDYCAGLDDTTGMTACENFEFEAGFLAEIIYQRLVAEEEAISVLDGICESVKQRKRRMGETWDEYDSAGEEDDGYDIMPDGEGGFGDDDGYDDDDEW